jgi:hypothetical protein
MSEKAEAPAHRARTLCTFEFPAPRIIRRLGAITALIIINAPMVKMDSPKLGIPSIGINFFKWL